MNIEIVNKNRRIKIFNSATEAGRDNAVGAIFETLQNLLSNGIYDTFAFSNFLHDV